MSRVQVLSPSQIVFSVMEHDVDTVGAHPEDISKPHNPPWTGSLVLESPGPLDGKDQPLHHCCLGSPTVSTFSLLFMGPDSEKVLEAVALNCPSTGLPT